MSPRIESRSNNPMASPPPFALWSPRYYVVRNVVIYKLITGHDEGEQEISDTRVQHSPPKARPDETAHVFRKNGAGWL
jgi:hypothetical protein